MREIPWKRKNWNYRSIFMEEFVWRLLLISKENIYNTTWRHDHFDHHHYHLLIIKIILIMIIFRRAVNLCSGSVYFWSQSSQSSSLSPRSSQSIIDNNQYHHCNPQTCGQPLFWKCPVFQAAASTDKADTVTLAQVSFAAVCIIICIILTTIIIF